MFVECPEIQQRANELKRLTAAAYKLQLWLIRHEADTFGTHDAAYRVRRVRYKLEDLTGGCAVQAELLARRLTYYRCGDTLCPVHGDPRDTSVSTPTKELCPL